MSTADVSAALGALEALSSQPASGPLTAVIENHIAVARMRLEAGAPPKQVITELQSSITRAKKEVERGLKAWYSAIGNVGKGVEKVRVWCPCSIAGWRCLLTWRVIPLILPSLHVNVRLASSSTQAFPPNLASISSAYDDPPLFSDPEAVDALDRVVLDSLGRRGLWDAVAAFEDETGLAYDTEKRELSEELCRIESDIEAGNLSSAIAWCDVHKEQLASGPNPSSLSYYLHRAVFLAQPDPAASLKYAQDHLFDYLRSQPGQVQALLTSCLYDSTNSPYANEAAPLAAMFRADYCRAHGWAREEPLEVTVRLGSRGGALNAIEKARRVMGDRLGNVRHWQELPVGAVSQNQTR
ncbi:uncharacterized protein EHS24_001148 [Apiotrichum porosum]|uniref:CTLH/CRA C-terminal to LisH motif domain-containing protein n=1 Tax=Apiotrichum porosum TaxID=105984 RepID=A0A427XJS2_9TREE|nr:uncharacterized protein EHS24_001148 [Apiotrichum porosum]RSH79110.1 hypothetical protein EHS24_001148 [Apiotrichum porosum]